MIAPAPGAGLPRLHAVTDDRVIAAGGVAERAAAMAEAAGAQLAVHVRSRALEGGAFLQLARAIGAAVEPHGAWLAVNGRADVARATGARAVVSGTGGLTVGDVRQLAPDAIVARSIHDESGAKAAAAEGADVLIAGAIYPSASHPGRAAAGPALLRQASAYGLPVIAIGGITSDKVGVVMEAGAWGVGVIRALWDARDPAAAARAFLTALPPVRPSAVVDVVVNGEARRFAAGSSLADLLGALGLDQRAVVVEHNRRIVRREGLAAARIAAGDQVELVHFVGGG